MTDDEWERLRQRLKDEINRPPEPIYHIISRQAYDWLLNELGSLPDYIHPYEPELSWDEIKKMREQALELSVRELERLADENKHRIHYATQEAYKMGVSFAVKEIEATERLFIKAHETAPYANPKEGEREHRNQMNTLATLKSGLIRRFQGKP